MFLRRFSLGILLFAISFFVIWSVSLAEKDRNYWVRSDCQGNANLTMEEALDDFFKPDAEEQGLTHCFCEQQFEQLGLDALDIEFGDGKNHC